jgi:hypothetical protein
MQSFWKGLLISMWINFNTVFIARLLELKSKEEERASLSMWEITQSVLLGETSRGDWIMIYTKVHEVFLPQSYNGIILKIFSLWTIFLFLLTIFSVKESLTSEIAEQKRKTTDLGSAIEKLAEEKVNCTSL